MKLKSLFLVLLTSILMFSVRAGYAVPAFPSAQGFGVNTVGGRGGQVLKVTNLNDSGSGSLRQAVETDGPRIIVFEVSGIINLQSDLQIFKPNITIAGQTSPGGILVTGSRTIINTHDVIIRYMRFRVGSHNVADAEKHDAVQVLGKYWANNEAYNIIFDHCSVGWGVDENMSVSGGVTGMTIQWNIISEGLRSAGHPKGQHSKGLLISGKYEFPNSVSIHHNYLAHNQDRSPLIYTPSDVETIADVVNNVVYNWKGGLSPLGEGYPKINWIHNYAKKGVNSNSYSREITHGDTSNPSPLLYVVGNIGSTRMSQSEPDWNVGNSWMDQDLNEAWKRDVPWDVPSVTTESMSHDYAVEVLQTVGASLPFRDSVDVRTVNDFINETGQILDNVSYPQDFPTFQNLPAPVDADNDGMADAWELTQGFNTSVNDSALDADGDGYTNIEEYLHVLAGDVEGVVPDPEPEPEPEPVGGKAPVITGAEVIYPSE